MDDTEEYYGATAAYGPTQPPAPPPPPPEPVGNAQPGQQPQRQFKGPSLQQQDDNARPQPPSFTDRSRPSPPTERRGPSPVTDSKLGPPLGAALQEASLNNTHTSSKPTPGELAAAAHAEHLLLNAASISSDSSRQTVPHLTDQGSLNKAVTFAAHAPVRTEPPPIPLSDATSTVLQEFDEVRSNLQASATKWDQMVSTLRRELGAQEVELDQIQLREGPALKMLAAIEGSKEEQPDKMVVARLRAVVLRAKEGRGKIADMRKKVERVLPKQVLYAKLMALHDTVGLRHNGVSWVQVEGVVAAAESGGETRRGGVGGGVGGRRRRGG
ncbi:MAG: hypothetical protein WDW38_006976 [Sanguina aurantia]